MSAHKEMVIKLTKEQQEEIKKALDREVTHVKFWLVPGTVILAEAITRPERLNTQ